MNLHTKSPCSTSDWSGFLAKLLSLACWHFFQVSHQVNPCESQEKLLVVSKFQGMVCLSHPSNGRFSVQGFQFQTWPRSCSSSPVPMDGELTQPLDSEWSLACIWHFFGLVQTFAFKLDWLRDDNTTLKKWPGVRRFRLGLGVITKAECWNLCPFHWVTPGTWFFGPQVRSLPWSMHTHMHTYDNQW